MINSSFNVTGNSREKKTENSSSQEQRQLGYFKTNAIQKELYHEKMIALVK